MTISFLSLPNEILTTIFDDRCLSNADLTRIQLTCKLFRENIRRKNNRRYTFKVDAVEHPTWRLIRYLLKNPEVGERIDEITVQWKRRDASDEGTWTTRWNWDSKECELIHKLVRAWCLDHSTERSIQHGLNSEALLPLLLVFTPNLKTLDMGDIDSELVKHGCSHHYTNNGAALRAIGESGGFGGKEAEQEFDQIIEDNTPYEVASFLFANLPYRQEVQEGDDYYIGYDPYDSSDDENPRRGQVPRRNPLQGPVHLQHLINPDGAYSHDRSETAGTRMLPGLASLEHFRVGNPACDETQHHSDSLSSPDISQFFFLPKMQSIQAFGVTDRSPHLYSEWAGKHKDAIARKSTVKHLTLRTLQIRSRTGPKGLGETFLGAISQFTSVLETLRVDAKMGRAPSSKDTERLGRLFLSENKGTLLPTKVFINGAAFTADGKFIPDAEKRQKLALRQELWERARAKLEGLNLKPSPIEGVPPEILTKIISFLEKNDSRNLIISSKKFHDPRYRSCWIELGFRNRAIISDNDVFLHQNLDHLKGFILPQYSPLCLEGVEPEFSDLNATLEAVENGTLSDLKRFLLVLRSGGCEETFYATPKSIEDPKILPDRAIGFLNILKSFSQRRDPSKAFEVHITMAIGQRYALEFCDMTKLTFLSVEQVWAGGREIIYQSLNNLKDLLSRLASTRLKHLSIGLSPRGIALKFPAKRRRAPPKEIDRDFLWKELQVIQEMIWGLKSLQSLAVLGSYLFHPSFVLLPPEGVRSLTYGGQMSPLWWRKFAGHPFTGVEQLRLDCRGLDGPNTQYLQELGEEPCSEFAGLRLGDVKISGLRWIEIVNLQGLENDYPSDFVDLVLKNNQRLSYRSLEAIALGRLSKYSGRLTRRFPKFVKEEKQRALSHLEAMFHNAKYQFTMEYVMNRRPLPKDEFSYGLFEQEMEKAIVSKMMKGFEDEFLAGYVKSSIGRLHSVLTHE
ncbi:hypothetical protein TWF718_004151 [Orbilia javanica]|uniref:F-box domain-containing protein n=1 Tax=Orbilia javanica TaxID=47235 RepID=A0AAN8MRU2_9PEZI